MNAIEKAGRINPMKTHLQFKLQLTTQGKKTCTWLVQSTSQDAIILGAVQWWSHWRKYVFFPKQNMLFDPDCMRQIADFCEAKTQVQKQIAAQRRSKIFTESWCKQNAEKEEGHDVSAGHIDLNAFRRTPKRRSLATREFDEEEEFQRGEAFEAPDGW